MKNLTKGQIEAQISEAIIKFEREYMGRMQQPGMDGRLIKKHFRNKDILTQVSGKTSI